MTDAQLVGFGITWVCWCLVGFIFSLHWPHECDHRACPHQTERRDK